MVHSNSLSWLVLLRGLVGLADGLTFVEASKVAGCSVRSLKRCVAEHGRMGIGDRKRRAGELTVVERDEIFRGVCRGDSDAAIARALGRHRGTVGREIARNGGREKYGPLQAEIRASRTARRERLPWTQQRPLVWKKVQELLRAWWSPEQISMFLRCSLPNTPDWHVSHEAIYQAIYIQAKGTLKTELVACLRTQRSKRRPQGRSLTGSGSSIKDLVPISQRPAEVEDRAVPGHWEGDLIIGKANGSAIATIVERSTRFGFMVRLDSKNAVHVAERVGQEAERLGLDLFKSLTWDQGNEMAEHRSFTHSTGIAVYFADPQSPWQRGTNENWNGLARQYFPKGTDLSMHSQDDLDNASRSLNTRPRKTLDWDTPALRFEQLVATTT